MLSVGVLLLEPPKIGVFLWSWRTLWRMCATSTCPMYDGYCACAADDTSSESECIVVCVYYGTYHNGVFLYLAHREYYLVDVNLQWGDICHVCCFGWSNEHLVFAMFLKWWIQPTKYTLSTSLVPTQPGYMATLTHPWRGIPTGRSFPWV